MNLTNGPQSRFPTPLSVWSFGVWWCGFISFGSIRSKSETLHFYFINSENCRLLNGSNCLITALCGLPLFVIYVLTFVKMVLESILGKKFKLSSSEKFDEYMKALGVGLVTRKVGNAVSPVVDLNKEGDDYILTSNSTFKHVVTKFQPGVEFDQETPDGRKVKATITVDGNTLKEVQKAADGKVTTIDRTFSEDEITMVMTVGDITATRIYKLQA